MVSRLNRAAIRNFPGSLLRRRIKSCSVHRKRFSSSATIRSALLIAVCYGLESQDKMMAGRSQVKQFNEIEEGDLILDFAPDVAIDPPALAASSGAASAQDLVFVVNGKPYVAKEISEKLAQNWDVTVQGRQLLRSVLVRVKT
jgi:hypothetical protein